MDLVLTEEQELLRSTARELVSNRSSLRRIRTLRDGADPDGFSRALWKEMAALGWLGIPVPVEHGGLGLGAMDLACVMEEVGRGLMPEPLLSTVVLGAGALLLGGSAAQQAAQSGARIVDRELAVRPTLRVRAGAPVRVLVTRDIVLRRYQQ